MPWFALYWMNLRQGGRGLFHSKRPDLIHLPRTFRKFQISGCSHRIASYLDYEVLKFESTQ